MTNSPKASHNRYQVIREIRRNPEESCITYLGKDNATQQPVSLTRFVLTQKATNKSGYEDYLPGFQQLQKLNHPGIPRYLDYFKTADGFCLVQNYQQNQPLNVTRNWTTEEIKQIGVSVLDILVYLQNHTPPIIHRNIKPESIFIDAQARVYLMDFNYAQIGGVDLFFNSITGKKSGFASPEELRNRPLTEASDLYSLGATLMCLLTQTEPSKINTLMGQDNRINVNGLVANEVSLGLIAWLETMLSPNPKQRYPNAIQALEALKIIDVTRFPEVQFNPASLTLKNNNFGEIITSDITVTNFIPDTILQANWDITKSLGNSPVSTASQSWITFEPAKFESNKTVCKISVDTKQLMAGKNYQRKILLNANSLQKIHPLTITITTAAIQPEKILFVSIFALLGISWFGGWFETLIVGITPEFLNWIVLFIGLVIGGVGGGAAAFSKINLFARMVGLILTLSLGVGLLGLGSDLDVIVGFVVGLVVAAVAGTVVKHHRKHKFSLVFSVIISILTATLGMSLGIDLTLKSFNPLVMLVVVITGLVWAALIINPYIKYCKTLYKYRKLEQFLIKP